MALGAVLLVIGLLVLAASSGLATWWLGWAVLGPGMALSLYDAAFATAGVALGPAGTAAITGIALLGGFASTVGWPVGSTLLPSLGWRGLLLAYAGIQLTVGLGLVLFGVPRGGGRRTSNAAAPSRHQRGTGVQLACMSGFFVVRWFITSAIAAHVLALLGGLGLSPARAMEAAALIGPAQVAGRLMEWSGSRWLGPLSRARLGALLFPVGAMLLVFGVPLAPLGFALLYGMSNGILTVNRGTLPMLVMGPHGYAARLGQIALPVMLAQATAPTLVAPLVTAVPSDVLLPCAGALAAVAALLLLPLRIHRLLPDIKPT